MPLPDANRPSAITNAFLRRFLDIWLLLSLLLGMALYIWQPYVLYVVYMMAGVGLVSRLAVHWRCWTLARWLLIAPLGVAIVASAYFLDGVRTPILGNFSMLVLLCAWLIGRRAMVGLATAMVVVFVGLWQMEAQGWWTMAAAPRPPEAWVMMWVGNLVVCTVIIGALVGSYETHFKRETQLRKDVAGLLSFTQSVLAHSPIPMRIFRADGQCINLNEAYARLAEKPREHLLAQNLNHPQDWQVPVLAQTYLHALQTMSARDFEISTTTGMGRELWLSMQLTPFEVHGQRHLLVQCVDYSERKRQEREWQHLALHDPLTHLPNRRVLYDRLSQTLLRNQRNGVWSALLYLDLNGFKQLNDTHGHEVGDAVLVQTAQRILKAVRASDTVARLGGDEFVVLLDNMGATREAAQEHAHLMRDKVQQALNQPYVVGALQCPGKASIGLHLFQGDDGALPEDILRQTDAAMYQDKNTRAAPL